MRLAALVSLLALGCSGSDTDHKSPDDTDTLEETGGTTDPTADTAPPEVVDVECSAGLLGGNVVTDAGASDALLRVQMCQGLQCLLGENDDEGDYCFDTVADGAYQFQAIPKSGLGLMTTMWVQTIDGTATTFDTTMVAHGDVLEIGDAPASYTPAPGITVDLPAAADLEIPFGITAELKAAVVPAKYWPAWQGGGTTALVVYFEPVTVYPSDNSGMALTLGSELGLADGTYALWQANYWQSHDWQQVADVTVKGGVPTVSAPIPELSTLVLVSP